MSLEVVLTAVLALYALPAMAAPCETLASVALPNAAISVAQTVAVGQFTPPAGTGTMSLTAAFG